MLPKVKFTVVTRLKSINSQREKENLTLSDQENQIPDYSNKEE